MAATRPGRLFIIKFLGLWGSQQQIDKETSFGDKKSTFQSNNSKTKGYESLSGDNNNSYQINDNDSIYKKAVEASSRKISSLMLEKGAPGLVVCVSKKGKVVWRQAFGFCDVENQIPCDVDAHMRIASISKPLFAATIIAPLLEEKKIDLKSSVHKYLNFNEFPKQKFDNREYDITIEQLLSHTSGVRSYKECKVEDRPLLPIGSKGSKKVYQTHEQYDREEFFTRKTFRNVIEALNSFKDDPLANKPGEYNYTTYGYTLLSAIVQKLREKDEQVDNKSKKQLEQIEDFWIKVLRKDWDLKDTYLDQDEPIIPNRARYYLRTGLNGTLINAPYTDLSVKWAGGGINSTASDIVKFGNKLIDCYKQRNNPNLKRETIDLLWKVIENNYALGFQVDKSKDGKMLIAHSGGAVGASSMLIIIPDSEIVVAMITNLGDVGLRELCSHILENFEKINCP